MKAVLERRIAITDVYLQAFAEGAAKRASRPPDEPPPPRPAPTSGPDVAAACVLPAALLAEVDALLREDRIPEAFDRIAEVCATAERHTTMIGALGDVVPFLESHDVWFPPAFRDPRGPFGRFMCVLSPARAEALHRQLAALDPRRLRDDLGMLTTADRDDVVACVAYLRDATANGGALAVFYG